MLRNQQAWAFKVLKFLDPDIIIPSLTVSLLSNQGRDLGIADLPRVRIQNAVFYDLHPYNSLYVLYLNFLFSPAAGEGNLFIHSQGSPLTFTHCFKLIINHLQPFIVFFQPIDCSQQEPSNSIVLIITNFPNPLSFMKYATCPAFPSKRIPSQFL